MSVARDNKQNSSPSGTLTKLIQNKTKVLASNVESLTAKIGENNYSQKGLITLTLLDLEDYWQYLHRQMN